MTTTTVTYLTQAQIHAAQHLSSRENTVIVIIAAVILTAASIAAGIRRTIDGWHRG